MRFLKRLRRRLQKKFFPTERDQIMRQWRDARGDEKLRLDYDLNRDSAVFDMGGFEGNWAHEIHRRYGCRVLIFEPVLEYANAIKQRFAGNPNIEVFPYGLAATTRTERIGLCSDGSSVFRQAEKTQEIKLHDAAGWLEEHPVGEIALMKINIEGGEYKLLERLLAASLVPRIANLQVQFHEIAPDSPARMEAIQRQLAATHAPTYQYKFVWENWRRISKCAVS
jgi:FkbM family methyltransferase